MTFNPLQKIIWLSVVLALGSLLIMTACISDNWYAILIGIFFALAHLPIMLATYFTDKSDYDFNFDPHTSSKTLLLKEMAKFVSAFLLVSGLRIPFMLHHAHLVTKLALTLSVIGGILIYFSVIGFDHWLNQSDDEEINELSENVV